MISLSINNGVAEVVLDAPHKLNSMDEQSLANLSHIQNVTPESDDAAA